MKKTIFAAALLLSAVSFGKSQKLAGITSFHVSSGQFAPAHVAHPGDGKLAVDYSKSLVNLFVVRDSNCLPGHMCSAMMLAPLLVELPIASVVTDNCNIHIVTAIKDSRPVDGSLQVITVKDASQITCETLVAVNSEAQYQTKYFDRVSGKEVEDTSTMQLTLVSELIRYQYFPGFSPNPVSKTITVDNTGKVSIVLSAAEGSSQNSTVNLQMSSADLKTLKSQIATIKPDAQLIDQNLNQPQCMDAPSLSVSVIIGLNDVVIYSFEGCHTSKVMTGAAAGLTKTMLGFASTNK